MDGTILSSIAAAERVWAAAGRARAETALRESEERYRAIVESARDYAIFTTDTEGRIETWPPGAEQVFGWTAEEAVGRPLDITFTPEDVARGAPDEERRLARERACRPAVIPAGRPPIGLIQRQGKMDWIMDCASPAKRNKNFADSSMDSVACTCPWMIP